jgi:hypothetical protein
VNKNGGEIKMDESKHWADEVPFFTAEMRLSIPLFRPTEIRFL